MYILSPFSCSAQGTEILKSEGLVVTLSDFMVTGGTDTLKESKALLYAADGSTALATKTSNSTSITFSESDLSSISNGNYKISATEEGNSLGLSAASEFRSISVFDGITAHGAKLYRSTNGIATTVETINPDGTSLKFEVIDAQYRKGLTFGTYGTRVQSRTYEGSKKFIDDKEYDKKTKIIDSYRVDDLKNVIGTQYVNDKSSKNNCDAWMIYNDTTDEQNIVGVPAVNYCRSITNDGGAWDLPRIWIVAVLWVLSDAIDELDPTASSYANLKLGYTSSSSRFGISASFIWSSTESNLYYCLAVYQNGYIHLGKLDGYYYNKHRSYGVTPIREL